MYKTLFSTISINRMFKETRMNLHVILCKSKQANPIKKPWRTSAKSADKHLR